MRKNLCEEKGFIGLLSLLFSLAVVCALAYFAYGVYFKKPIADQQTQEMLSSQNIDTSTPKTILDSTRTQIKGMEKMIQERESQVLDDAEQYR